MIKFRLGKIQAPTKSIEDKINKNEGHKVEEDKNAKKKALKIKNWTNFDIKITPKGLDDFKGNKVSWNSEFKIYNSNSKELKTKFYKVPNMPHSITHGFKMFKRKTALEYLLTMIQYPSPFKINPGISIFLNLSEKFRTQLPQKQLPLAFNTSNITNNSNNNVLSKQLCIKAIQIFLEKSFDNINLFYEPEFNFFKKSKNLQYTILACGLSWMEPTEEVKKAINYLNLILYKQFFKLHSIKPSLQNLQSILLIIKYLSNFKWVTMMRVRFALHIQSIAINLGLHIDNKRLPLNLRLERKFAYSAIVFFSGSVILTCGSHMFSPYKLIILNENDLNNLNNANYNIIKLKCLLNQFFCQFCLELGSIFYTIRILKEHYITSDISEEQLNSISKRIRNQLEKSTFKWIYQLKQIEVLDKNNQIGDYITRNKNKILFLNHFCQYFISSFKFYQPLPVEFNYNPNPTKQEIKSKRYRNPRQQPDSTILLQTLQQACKVIEYTPNLTNFKILPAYIIPFMSQALTFILRNYKIANSNEINSCIQLGLNKIKQLESNVNSMWLFKFDTAIIKVISNLTKE